jgi:2-oxoglutarate ferredoxin oxidoreductase subunit alpha
VIYADSDEHTQEGHITEDAALRAQMVEKRLYKKMSGLEKEIEPPSSYACKGAKVLLLGFGSTYGVIKETCEALQDKKIGFIHLSQLWPFPKKEIKRLLHDASKIITVENNAGGQLARLLRREIGINVDGSILKYDGRPFNLDELIAQVKKGLRDGHTRA